MELTAFTQWLNSAFSGYDRAILSALHRAAESMGGLLTPLTKLITLLGEKGILFFLLALGLMCFARTRKLGVCLFGAVACGALLTNIILKDWVARPRPFEADPLFREFWIFLGSPAEDGYSFPSGHMTAAAAGMSAICLVRGRKWLLPSALVMLLMGFSRNYLMAHYPSDVLFALVIGIASALIAWGITGMIFNYLEDNDDFPLCEWLLKASLSLPKPDGGYVGKHERRD